MRNGPQGLEEVNMTQFREQKGSPKVEWETEGATSSSSGEDLCLTTAWRLGGKWMVRIVTLRVGRLSVPWPALGG